MAIYKKEDEMKRKGIREYDKVKKGMVDCPDNEDIEETEDKE